MKIPDGMDQIDAREVSHALLLALLAEHHGGAAVLPIAGLEAATGDREGRMWSVVIEPMDGPQAETHVRVSVVHVPFPEEAPR